MPATPLPSDLSAAESTSAAERRTEERTPAKGAARLYLGDGSEVIGELKDVSASGFRIGHTSRGLARDEVVRFRFTGRTGQARVMWNRWIGDGGESGLLIVE